MKCTQLLFACSNILTVTSCIRVDRYSCMTAFWNTVTCTLNITGNPTNQFNYRLTFTGSETISCPIVKLNHSYSCVCKLTNLTIFPPVFYAIKLCHESDCYLVTENFDPSQFIQLTPPHRPVVQPTPETFNISWKSGYEDHWFLEDILDYELLLQTSQSQDRKVASRQTSVQVQRGQLKPHATYCVKVRAKPPHPEYQGDWSEWSPSTCQKNDTGEEPDDTFALLTNSLGQVFVVIGVLLLFGIYCATLSRMKIKTSHIPSPAPFFQPLYQQHDGNLKEWLSPQGSFVLTYKSEEIITTGAVIVDPKPMTKEQKEHQHIRNSLGTHLEFPQCQSSYVGLPGIHEAPPPLPVVCPGNMSYTQLPCSVWEVGIRKKEEEEEDYEEEQDYEEEEDYKEEVIYPPDEFLNVSHADSGCSCNELSERPECTLSNISMNASPPVCICSDYCILNKTAQGFTPTLLSSPNVPADSPQED